MCVSAKRTMNATTRLPSLARHFGASVVIANLSPAGWELVDDVALVLSELANLAMSTPATSRVIVSVLIHIDEIELSVRATAPGSSADAVQVDDITTQLLTDATVAWGLRDADDGYEAWARLACDAEYALGVACDRRTATSGGINKSRDLRS